MVRMVKTHWNIITWYFIDHFHCSWLLVLKIWVLGTDSSYRGAEPDIRTGSLILGRAILVSWLTRWSLWWQCCSFMTIYYRSVRDSSVSMWNDEPTDDEIKQEDGVDGECFSARGLTVRQEGSRGWNEGNSFDELKKIKLNTINRFIATLIIAVLSIRHQTHWNGFP